MVRGGSALALLPPPKEELTVADVQTLHADMATLKEGQRNLTKLVERAVEGQDTSVARISELETQVAVLMTRLEERDKAEAEQDRAKQDAKSLAQSKVWQELAEKWVLRIGAGLGALAAAAEALGS